MTLSAVSCLWGIVLSELSRKLIVVINGGGVFYITMGLNVSTYP
jgi:hypothetical protein